MIKRTRPLAIALGALPFVIPGSSFGAAIGDVLYQSSIGEPLRVELRLSGSDLADIGNCLRLIPKRSTDPGIVSIYNGRIAVEGIHAGEGKAVVTSPQLGDAIVQFTLENTCTTFKREYTVLLAPPAAAPLVRAYTAPAVEPARRAPPPQVAPRRSSGAGYDTWRTAHGESLASIAASLYPRDERIQQAFVERTLRANPKLFTGDTQAETPLPAGTALRVPAPSTRWPRTEARRPVASASVSPRAPRTAETTPASNAASRTEDRARKDQLVLQRTVSPSAAQLPGPDTPLSPEAYRAREQQLLDNLSTVITAQRQLAERVAQLEAIQTKLLEQVQQLNKEKTAAVPVAPPQTVSNGSSNLQTVLFVAGGVVLAGFLLWRRRNSGVAAEDNGQELLSVEPASMAETRAEPVLPAAGAKDSSDSAGSAPLAPLAPNPNVAPLEFGENALIAAEESLEAEEHDSAIELADIMMSFGRIQGAAETLADFIRANPKRAITPWLKLLEVYRAANMRTEFDALTRQLNKTFNVMIVSWDRFHEELKASQQSVEQMPHIMDNLTKLWPSRECQIYLNTLIRDNRDGTRQGFPLGLIDDLLMLAGVLDLILGPYPADQLAPQTSHA